MADANLGEARQFDMDTGGGTDLAEISGIIFPASGGGVVVGGFDLTGQNALAVAIVDSSGNQVGPGTQYAEDGALGSTPTGTLQMYRRDDALATLTPVEDDAISGRVNNRGALWVSIADGSGNQITSFGGGTQYVEDVAFGGNGTGTLMIARRDDVLSALTPIENDAVGARVDGFGALWTTLAGDGVALHTTDALFGGPTWSPSGHAALKTVSVPWMNDADDSGQFRNLVGHTPSSDARGTSFHGLQTNAYGHVYNGTNWVRARGTTSGLQVHGPTASDAALTVSPLTIGGRASTAVPTAVSADGDVVDARFLRTGALTVHVVDAAGAAQAFGGGTQYVGDAAATSTPTGTIAMGLASAAAPSDVSADNDAVAAWRLRNGAAVVNLASGGTLLTVGQKVMASSFPVVIASDQSALTVAQATAANLNAQVVGTAAQDAAISGNPVAIGFRASTATPSAMSTDGDVVYPWATRTGALVVDGGIAHDAVDSGNPIKVGGKAYTTGRAGAAVTNADRADLTLDTYGRVSTVSGSAFSGADAVGNTEVRLPDAGTTSAYPLSVVNYAYNGTNWDRLRGDTSGLLAHGPTASDAALTVAPVTVGARASTAVPTAVSADGDVVDLRALRTGALTVHVVDAAGAAASLGGGTQYVGDAAATSTPTGTMQMALANTSAPTDVSAGNDAVALWASPKGALNVIIRDTAGAAVSTGTQYTEDGAITADAGIGTLVVARRDDALSALTPAQNDAVGLRVGDKGALWVQISDGSGNQITSFGGGTQYVGDAPATATPTGTMAMALANAAAPSDVSANADAVGIWALRNGAQVVNLASGGTLIVGSPGATTALSVGGPTASDSPIAASPVTVGGRASTAVPTAVSADGDVVNIWTSRLGVQYVGHASGSGDIAGVSFASDGSTRNAGVGAASLWTDSVLSLGRTTSTYDPARSTEFLSAAPNVMRGVLAAGVGPGFDSKTNPTGVAATSTANAVTVVVDGADSVTFHVTTIGTTPGSMIFETTGDDTNWATAGAVIKLGSLETFIEGSFVPAVNDVYMVRTTGLRQVRYRVNAVYASGTATVKVTSSVGPPIIKAVEMGGAPHKVGYALASATAQYTTTQTSTTIGPTVTSAQRMVVTSIQIQVGGTTAGELQVYFGTGAYARGTNKAIFDGEFAPSATSKPGVVMTPSVPWMGAADEELKVTDSAALNKLTITYWYYLVAA